MSKDLGRIKRHGYDDLTVTQFWGGDDQGICVQLTGYMPDKDMSGYVQMNAGEIIALLPVLKDVVNAELTRKREEAARAIEENKELLKSIVEDIRDVNDMAIAQPVLNIAALLSGYSADFHSDPPFENC